MDNRIVAAIAGGLCGGASYYIGYELGRGKELKDQVERNKSISDIITYADINADIVKWVAEEGAAMPWEEFMEGFTEKLEYLDIVRRTLLENHESRGG